jgi:hypothetical protein
MNRQSRRVEQTGQPHPAKIAAEAGAPNYRGYAGVHWINRSYRRAWLLSCDNLCWVRLGKRGIDPRAADVIINVAFDIG